MISSLRKYLTHIGQTTSYTDAHLSGLGRKIPIICEWIKEWHRMNQMEIV